MSVLLFKDTIAAAVAREVERGDAEGLAYKAQFGRQIDHEYLSEELELQLCADAARDAQLMNALTAEGLE